MLRLVSDSDVRQEGLRLVFYWRQADWGFFNRRNEALARTLSEHPAVADVLHLEAVTVKGILASAVRAIFVRDAGVRAAYRCQVRKAVSRRPVRVAPGLAVKSLRLFTFAETGVLAQLNRLWLSYQIRRLGVARRDALLAYPPAPYMRAVVDLLQPTLLMADLVDDVPAQESNPQRREAITRAFVGILGDCHAVFATSNRLAEKYGAHAGCDIEFLPNGVTLSPSPATTPASRARGDGMPKVGYVGVFNDTVDWTLLESLVAWNPDVEFVLIGPILGPAGGTVRQLASRYANCSYLGRRQHREVRAHIEQWQVLLNIKQVDEKTQANDSMKIYEYLATGKPVVSTLMPPADRLGDVVYTADDPHAFQHALKQALAEQSEVLADRRRAVAAENAWTSRAQRIIERIQQARVFRQRAAGKAV